MKMERPPDAQQTGGLLTGNIMSNYMRDFSQEFIQDRVRFNSEVIRIRRGEKSPWIVTVEDVATNVREDLKFSRIVLCTGVSIVVLWQHLKHLMFNNFQGCSSPKIPESLSLYAAEKARFRGLVLHSAEFGARLDDILAKVKAGTGAHTGSVVVVGGGKSAQEYVYLLLSLQQPLTPITQDSCISCKRRQESDDCLRHDRCVHRVLETFAPLRTEKQVNIIYITEHGLILTYGRLFSVLSPHSDINTRLECVLKPYPNSDAG